MPDASGNVTEGFAKEETKAVRSTRSGPLNREIILDRALAIVREHGLDKLSMRRLASEVGVTPMALYHYFADRDHLVAAICDQVLGEIVSASQELQGNWRERVLGLAWLTHDVIRRHPGIAQVMWTAPARGKRSLQPAGKIPELARLIDRYALWLKEGGVDGKEAAQFFHTVLLITISAIDQAERKSGPGRGRKTPPKSIKEHTPCYAEIYPQFFEFNERDVIRTVVSALLAKFD